MVSTLFSSVSLSQGQWATDSPGLSVCHLVGSSWYVRIYHYQEKKMTWTVMLDLSVINLSKILMSLPWTHAHLCCWFNDNAETISPSLNGGSIYNDYKWRHITFPSVVTKHHVMWILSIYFVMPIICTGTDITVINTLQNRFEGPHDLFVATPNLSSYNTPVNRSHWAIRHGQRLTDITHWNSSYYFEDSKAEEL